jgi:adenosylcobinamide-GDP ribazoletransferase
MDRETQSAITGHLRDWGCDISLAVTLLTRIPMPYRDAVSSDANSSEAISPDDMARAQRAFPLVGALVGLAVGLVDRCFLAIGVPGLAAAALALGAGAALTGALHEDGLADVGDGFGGGRDRDAKLAIMRDSRVGTYGVLVLLISFVAKASALASLPIAEIIPALIATHALARAAIPVLAANLPFARDDGLGRSAGRPDSASVIIAVVIAIVVALLCLPVEAAIVAVLMTAAGATVMAVLAWRQIGGITGDVFGAVEQVAETTVLLTLAAQLS